MARRSGLGKGLSALIPTEVAKPATSLLRDIPVTSIRPNRLQPRAFFDEEALSSLAASIQELGVLQPILVRQLGEDDFELIAGERRWRAARRVGLQTVPALVQPVDDVMSLKQALVENLHREDLNPLEEATAYQQLIEDFDLTHEDVATQVGKSRAAITNTLRLLQLPATVQRLLADGQLTAGHARALLGTPDRSLQEELARQIVSDGLSVRIVEERVRWAVQSDREIDPKPRDDVEVANPEDQPGSQDAACQELSPDSQKANLSVHLQRLRPPGLLELEELLATLLDTRVRVEMGQKKGRVVIEFATLEDLERIYRAMIGSK